MDLSATFFCQHAAIRCAEDAGLVFSVFFHCLACQDLVRLVSMSQLWEHKLDEFWESDVGRDAFFGRAAHESFEHLALHATVKYEVLEVNLPCTAGVEQFKHDTQVLHLGILQSGSICSLRAMRLVRVPLLHKERAESHIW